MVKVLNKTQKYSPIAYFLVAFLFFIAVFVHEQAAFIALFWISFVFLFFCLGISFCFINCLLVAYVLLPLTIQALTGSSFGALEASAATIPIYLEEEYLYVQIYLFVFLALALIFDLKNKERKLFLRAQKSLKNNGYIWLSLAAMVFTVIRYPTLPGFQETARYTSLLPGNAWNLVSLVCLYLCLPYLKKPMVLFSYIFVLLWCLTHAERVDVIGELLIIVLLFWHRKPFSMKRFFWLLLFGLAGFAIFAAIGYGRAGLSQNASAGFASLFRSIALQSTVCDIAHNYNIAVAHFHDYGLLGGQTYINYIVKIIPSLSYMDMGEILNERYGHPGGCYFLAEPLCNFGVMGVALFPVLQVLVLRYFFLGKHRITDLYSLLFISTCFRTEWYGLRYIETAVIYIIPIVYYIVKKRFKFFRRRKTLRIILPNGME